MRNRLLAAFVLSTSGAMICSSTVAAYDWGPFCTDYADRADAQADTAFELELQNDCTNPEFDDPFLWTHRQVYYDGCIRTFAEVANPTEEGEMFLRYVNYEKARLRGIEACQAEIAARGSSESMSSGTTTLVDVNGDVDLYDEPGGTGTIIGMLEGGSTIAFQSCRTDNWCEVEGGWVWGDFLDR